MNRQRRFGVGIPRAVGFEQLPVMTTAIGFQSLPVNATHAIIHVRGDDVRWRADQDPTVSLGIRLNADSYWEMMESHLDWRDVFLTMRFISLGSLSTLDVQFFG